MGKIGYGYGSEWHLLRYLGYHREYLSQKVVQLTGGSVVEWLDFEFSAENAPLRDDREFVGLQFITDTQVQTKWKAFWPQTGNAQNWDAVGKIHFDDRVEWLLLEAKAHIGETESTCGAKSPTSRQKIKNALTQASCAFGNRSEPIEHWLAPYYQYANRLTVLYFLMQDCVPPIPARLLFLYFYGERHENLTCPQSEQEWMPAIQKTRDWLGIDEGCALAQRVHSLFLPVNPAGRGKRARTTDG